MSRVSVSNRSTGEGEYCCPWTTLWEPLPQVSAPLKLLRWSLHSARDESCTSKQLEPQQPPRHSYLLLGRNKKHSQCGPKDAQQQWSDPLPPEKQRSPEKPLPMTDQERDEDRELKRCLCGHITSKNIKLYSFHPHNIVTIQRESKGGRRTLCLAEKFVFTTLVE